MAFAGNELVAKIDRFGYGARRSDFEVRMEWSDIEQFIAHFSQAKHPAAVEFESALKLTRALAAEGWKPPEISN
jgi:hypothetical protein